MEKEKIVEFFQNEFFSGTYGTIFQGVWKGYEVYSPIYIKGLHIGINNFGLVKDEVIRMATYDEAVTLCKDLDI